MKQYFGNYLGVVVTGGEKDPEGRGRCQVFIPHIMPALYEGWNQENTDISFAIIGDGLPEGLNPEIVSRLQKILPWAECAAPIVGASPSVKNGSEAIRNIASTAGSNAIPIEAFGGSAEDNDKFAALTSVAAQNSFRGGLCGTAVGEILENVYGYSEQQIRAGASDNRRDGKNYNDIMSSLGWQAVSISSPTEAPPNSIVAYGPDRDNKWGHVEYVGINPSGQKAFYYGLGGANGVSRPGGGDDGTGFSGIAWVPPTEVTNAALGKLGIAGINPSSVGMDSGINMKSDGSDVPLEGASAASSIDTSNMSSDFKSQYDTVYAALEGSKFINTVPDDGATYGIKTGSREEWAHMFTRLASTESSFTANKSSNIEGGPTGTMTSFGVYQIGSDQFYRHGGGNIYNANDNTNAFVNYAEEMYFGNTYSSGGNNVIGGKNGNQWLGLAAAYGPIRNITNNRPDENQKQLLAENMSAAEKESSSYTANAINTNTVVRNPTPYRMQSGPPTSNQARGMFGYASEGTTVWIFFREGNPMFPVYFAASYGQREWQNMYQYGSGGVGAGTGPGGAKPGTEAVDMRLYGGGVRSLQITEESGLDAEFVHQVYGQNGSNLTFMKDHTEFNSLYDHVNRVLGDQHDITEANREVRVRGDQNHYIEQDVYITIGNWSDEAVAASDEIQSYINEAMEVKSNAGKA